jgi:hypothetical protein
MRDCDFCEGELTTTEVLKSTFRFRPITLIAHTANRGARRLEGRMVCESCQEEAEWRRELHQDLQATRIAR